MPRPMVIGPGGMQLQFQPLSRAMIQATQSLPSRERRERPGKTLVGLVRERFFTLRLRGVRTA